MKLLFKGTPNFPEYHGNGIDAKAGDIKEIDDVLSDYLQSDFPGIWVIPEIKKVESKTADMVKAPVDKQIKKPFKRK